MRTTGPTRKRSCVGFGFLRLIKNDHSCSRHQSLRQLQGYDIMGGLSAVLTRCRLPAVRVRLYRRSENCYQLPGQISTCWRRGVPLPWMLHFTTLPCADAAELHATGRKNIVEFATSFCSHIYAAYLEIFLVSSLS